MEVHIFMFIQMITTFWETLLIFKLSIKAFGLLITTMLSVLFI